MSTIPPLSGPPLYRYIPGVGRAVAQDLTVAKYSTFGGNVLVVDQVYGNDTLAAQDPFNRPFLTIQAALNKATAGQCVFVQAGIYNETLVIPDNVSLQGVSAQSVVVQRLNVTSDTTLITMGNNCRVDTLTAILSSSANVNLIGCEFPTGTSITAKLRNSIWTVTSTAAGANTILGVRSAGTSSTAYSSPNAIQRTTLNVVSAGTGPNRGILVSGPNRFAVRDIVVFVRGAGSNLVGVETTHASAVAEIKTTTISGTTYDINQTAGSIVISSTDLVNHSANGNSFTTVTAVPATVYGVTKNINQLTTRYLLPGNTDYANTETTAVGVPMTQAAIIFEMGLYASSTLPTSAVITINLYRNTVGTPFMTGALNNGTQSLVVNNTSQSFAVGDRLIVEMVTSGATVGTIPFFVNVLRY
jgi:hypothetical protein